MGNQGLISDGLIILQKVARPYVANALKDKYGQDWWSKGVLSVSNEHHMMNLPNDGTDEELIESMDIALCLNLIKKQWNEVFKYCIPSSRNWVYELITVRNNWAHPVKDISDWEMERALDTMAMLCEKMGDSQSAAKIRGMYPDLVT